MAAFCLPAWRREILVPHELDRRLSSGCETVDGFVECAPETMRQHASRSLGRGISLLAYTLARYIASEHGGGTPEEKVLLGLLAIRQARLRGQDAHRILACTNVRGTCQYGPIHADGDIAQHPYGRWASTSMDPKVSDVLAAELALSGRVGEGFTRDANDQFGAKYFLGNLSWVASKAMGGHYWVGPIPGVNHFEVFAFRTIPGLSPSSPEGAAWVTYTIQALQAGPPDWSGVSTCSGGAVALTLITVGALALATTGALYIGTRQGHQLRFRLPWA